MARILLIVLLGWLLPGVALAADDAERLGLKEADRGAIQKIIGAQMDALKNDDGETAFSFASPTVRGIFGTAAKFMNMVKGGYHPVYRPKVVSFGEIVSVRGEPVQKVFILGENGAEIVAAYVMERQLDGGWKINGVYLFRDTSEGT